MTFYQFDMMEILSYVENAVNGTGDYAHGIEKDRLGHIEGYLKHATKLLSHYLDEDKNHIFHEKYNKLVDIKKSFRDLRTRAEHYFQQDQGRV